MLEIELVSAKVEGSFKRDICLIGLKRSSLFQKGYQRGSYLQADE